MPTILERFMTMSPWAVLVWCAIEWENANGREWSLAVVFLFILSTVNIEYHKEMPKLDTGNRTSCYALDGYRMALFCRVVALTLAVVQIIVTRNVEDVDWTNAVNQYPLTNVSVTYMPDHFERYYIWTLQASVFYALSGLILLITLCQCGINLVGSEKMILFRWASHDLVLGFIWITLCVQFHDVVNDVDDSKWRSLFCSMVIFHVIVLLIEIFGNKGYNLNCMSGPRLRPCWSEETKPAIFMMVRFAMYGLIYYSMLVRLHDKSNMVVNMKFVGWGLGYTTAACSVLIFLLFVEGPATPIVRVARKTDATKNLRRVVLLNF
jgi:hypothetical protein